MITQIKGKGNRKPIDKYLPAVQDFIRSGGYTVTGDLNNSGLRDLGKYPKLDDWVQKYMPETPQYVTEAEYTALENKFLAAADDKLLNDLAAPIKRAKGGNVERVYNDRKYL